MELTSKQRAQLRAMCNTLPVVLYIGKDGITDATVKEAWDALEARDLIKLRVLENSGITSREAADELSEKLGAEVVSVIGSRFVLYRRSSVLKNRKIELPK